jgi:mannose-6-phosphate isomerase-like protein (cupin superfamily)
VVWAQTADYVGKVLSIRAGQRTSLQYHVVKEETLRVQSGMCLFEAGPLGGPAPLATMRLKVGDVVHISPNTVHRFTGLCDLELVEVSTIEIDDVVRLEDDYGRGISE